MLTTNPSFREPAGARTMTQAPRPMNPTIPNCVGKVFAAGLTYVNGGGISGRWVGAISGQSLAGEAARDARSP
jgi:hypothetical protein